MKSRFGTVCSIKNLYQTFFFAKKMRMAISNNQEKSWTIWKFIVISSKKSHKIFITHALRIFRGKASDSLAAVSLRYPNPHVRITLYADQAVNYALVGRVSSWWNHDDGQIAYIRPLKASSSHGLFFFCLFLLASDKNFFSLNWITWGHII